MKLVDPMRYVKLKAYGRLPSPKGIVLAILRMLQRDDYRNDELVRLVKSDPAIAGELLKFSNAASFGHLHPITSLPQAVTVLGTSQLRTIVIAFSVLNNNRVGNCPKFNYEKFWSRALASAISAQALATYAKVDPEENFTSGLLCSLGELAMASTFPEEYCGIISQSDNSHDRTELERKTFGTDRRELSATLLLTEWRLPLELATAIYHCEDPDEADLQDGSRIQVISLSLHIALAFADICVAEDAKRGAMLSDLYIKAARLGMSQEETKLMDEDINTKWQEWGRFLKIQTRQTVSIDNFAKSTL